MDQGSTKKRSAVHNFVPTVTKFCVMWEGLSLPHDTKFGNYRCEIVGRRVIFIWSLICGSSWSGLIKAGPGLANLCQWKRPLREIITRDGVIHHISWDHSGYGLSQWEKTLLCNVVSHWLSPYQEWSLSKGRLTHWGLYKMTAIFQDISKCFFVNQNISFFSLF